MVSGVHAEVLDIGVVANPKAPEDVGRGTKFGQLSGVCWPTPSHVTKNSMAWTLDVRCHDASTVCADVDSELVESASCLDCVSYVLSKSNNACFIQVCDSYRCCWIEYDIPSIFCPQRDNPGLCKPSYPQIGGVGPVADLRHSV